MSDAHRQLERTDRPGTVGVIVLLYKNAAFMPALFEGLAASTYPKDLVTLHLVDNAPGDGSLDEARRQIARFGSSLPEVRIHEPGQNTGFTGGNDLVMRELIDADVEFCYLLNGDASFEPTALAEAVAVAETDPKIGAVQSLLVLQQEPDVVNSWGNEMHYLGFGYAAGYRSTRTDAPDHVTHISYPSGAGVLLRSSVLRIVGLFEERFVAYHEDLDLGWRIRLAGYWCVLAPKSVVRHHYEFSRSIQKWYWMERNRWLVLLMNYRIATLVVLAPQLLASEAALWCFAIARGWWRDRIRVYAYFWKAETWRYISARRKAVAAFRVRKDREILSLCVPTIAYQDVESPLVRHLLNPIGRAFFWLTRIVVFW